MLAAHALLTTAGLELFRPGGVSVSINDLHSAYGTIFPTGNRNAASHKWSSWIIERSSTMSKEDFHTLFTGFCPVSGSPVQPSQYNTYRYSLPGVLPGSPATVGTLHHCCAPCVCDTRDLIHADVKTVQLAAGAQHQFRFAVIGDLACGEFPSTLSRLTKFNVHAVSIVSLDQKKFKLVEVAAC